MTDSINSSVGSPYIYQTPPSLGAHLEEGLMPQPFFEYITQAIEKFSQCHGVFDEDTERFLWRAKETTSIDESDFFKIPRYNRPILFSICPFLRIFIECDGQMYPFSVETLQEIAFFNITLTSEFQDIVTYRSIAGRSELSILTLTTSEEEKIDASLFFNIFSGRQSIDSCSENEFKALMKMADYFQSNKIYFTIVKYWDKYSSENCKKWLDFSGIENAILDLKDRIFNNISHVQPLIDIHGSYVLRNITTGLKNNPEFMQRQIDKYGLSAFQYLGEELRRNGAFMKPNVEKYGFSTLKYLPENLEIDEGFYHFILIKHGYASDQYIRMNIDPYKINEQKEWIKRAHNEFKNRPEGERENKNIVDEYVKKYRFNFLEGLAFLGTALRNDKDFMTSLMDIYGFQLLQYLGSELQDDKGFMLPWIQKYGATALSWIGPKLKNDKNFMRFLIETYGSESLRYLGSELQDDKEFMLPWIQKYGATALSWIGPKLKNDKNFMRFLIETYGSESLRYLGSELQDDKEFMSDQIRRYEAKALRYLGAKLADDVDYMIQWIEEFGFKQVENYFSGNLQNNTEFKALMIEKYGSEASEYFEKEARDSQVHECNLM
ncbi:MAG: DUF4116 domain-containing protein [Chlamydia sp.]